MQQKIITASFSKSTEDKIFARKQQNIACEKAFDKLFTSLFNFLGLFVVDIFEHKTVVELPSKPLKNLEKLPR